MPRKGKLFRVGRVRVCARGRVWYLCYYENGKRERPRDGAGRGAAKRLAAEIHAQLEAGPPRPYFTAISTLSRKNAVDVVALLTKPTQLSFLKSRAA